MMLHRHDLVDHDIMMRVKVMPPEVRQLKAALSKAGFSVRPGKGSHTV